MTSPQNKVKYHGPSEPAFSKLPFLITPFTHKTVFPTLITLSTHKTVFPTLFIMDSFTLYHVLSNFPESAYSVGATRSLFSLKALLT